MEKPAIATEVGGTGESVRNGETGFLTRRGDSGEVAAALAALIKDPELRLKQAQSARRRFLQQFTLDRQMRETIEIYNGLLARQSEP